MNNKSKNTAKRLIGYAMKYKWRFIYGVLAGFLVGLSLFAMLTQMNTALNPKAAAEAAQKMQELGDLHTDYIKDILNFFGFQKLNADGSITKACTVLMVLSLPMFFGIKGFFTYINRYCMRWLGTNTIADVRNDLFKNLSNQSLGFYSKNDAGSLLSRINNDTGIAEQLISSSIADLTRGPMEIVACVSFMIYHAFEKGIFSISLALIIAAPLVIIPVFLLGRKIKKFSRKALQRISILTSHMLETFTGIRVVKAYHMEAAEHKRFVANNEDYVSKVVRGLRYELLIAPVMEMVGVTIICVFIVYAYFRGLVFEDIAPFGAAAALAYQPFKRLGKVLASLQRSLVGAERAFEFIDLKPDLVETEGAVVVNAFEDKFEFKNVSFKYDENGPQIIDDLSLDIKKGEMIAFVGETGSGKSTVSNLLARFYDPSSGSITIDGVNLKEVEVESLRNLIGVVTQDTIIFNDSIAFNIAYGTESATEEDIILAAKKANAHEFILEKEDGYNARCGEKGFNLSGGQKQRVSIARAILKNPPILILDEATSALDTQTEQLVQDALNNLMGNRTVFAIAHRLSTIKHADKICVLEQGRIIEIGSHDELYAKNGKYRHLCDLAKFD